MVCPPFPSVKTWEFHVEKAKRNERGQFLPGASGNPAGRPPSSPEMFIKAARTAVTPEQFADAIKRLYEHFIETGSVKAFKELRDTLAGRPAVTEASGDKRFDAFLELVRERQAELSVDPWTGLPAEVVEVERERRESGQLAAEHAQRDDPRL